jgi:hypothetical protein
MRAKLDEKKKAKDVVLEKKGDNLYSFKLDGQELQEKSMRPDMRIPNDVMPSTTMATVPINDDWLDEPDKTSPIKSSVQKKKGKGKGKGKK